ncbi:MAG TPA: hypothetical protein DCK98_00065 [Chloroflexi bacterium]|nr:hypothetical protein [Chloroflexota bacterium]HAL28112.1 hypothetical protein [Chloroflexota bacterium]
MERFIDRVLGELSVRRVGREERGVAAGFGIVERNNHGLESASGVGSAQLIECQVDPRAVRSVLVPQPAR